MLSETALRELDAYRDEVPQLRKDLAAANERAEQAERERDGAMTLMEESDDIAESLRDDNARLREKMKHAERELEKITENPNPEHLALGIFAKLRVIQRALADAPDATTQEGGEA